MTALESLLFPYLLNSLWQVPLVFIAAWIVARLARQLGSRMEHRVWVGALVLQAILPLCHVHLNGLRRLALAIFGSAPGGQTRVFIAAGSAATTAAVLRLPSWILPSIVLMYVCCLLYFAGRLAWSLRRTFEMRRHSTRVTLTSEQEQRLDRCSRFFRISDHAVQVASAPTLSGPVTVGIRQWTLLLPSGFLNKVQDSDLDAVFAHECAHLRSRDFAKNLFYGFITLPLA